MRAAKSYKHTKYHGFTIIELMIVMAIAGLIMVIVFLAVPQVQASRRDATRKEYARSIHASFVEYIKNNGNIPACNPLAPAACSTGAYDPGRARNDALRFLGRYMPTGVSDPSTGQRYATGVSSVCGHGSAFPNDGGTGCTGGTVWRWDAQSAPGTHEAIPDVGEIFIHSAHWCYVNAPDGGPSNSVVASRNNTPAGDHLQLDKFAIVVGLEKGAYYCIDNYIEDRP